MGLAHCPICIGLAVLSAIRFSAHALLLWQLRRPDDQPRLRLRTA